MATAGRGHQARAAARRLRDRLPEILGGVAADSGGELAAADHYQRPPRMVLPLQEGTNLHGSGATGDGAMGLGLRAVVGAAVARNAHVNRALLSVDHHGDPGQQRLRHLRRPGDHAGSQFSPKPFVGQMTWQGGNDPGRSAGRRQIADQKVHAVAWRDAVTLGRQALEGHFVPVHDQQLFPAPKRPQAMGRQASKAAGADDPDAFRVHVLSLCPVPGSHAPPAMRAAGMRLALGGPMPPGPAGRRVARWSAARWAQLVKPTGIC
jgi:hypothetical protein